MSVQGMWQSFQATGDAEARDGLINQYAPLVKYVVGRVALPNTAVVDRDDLISFGTLGLMDAIGRFDMAHGVKFETYAIQRIRGSVIDAFRKLDLVSRGARRRVREIEGAQAELRQTLGREPGDAEVAERLGLTRAGLDRALQDASCVILSMDRPLASLDGDDGLTVADTIEDERAVAPASAVERTEEREALMAALQGLGERDRLIVSLYYYEELTLREISDVLGVTESRVCQLHARALTRLRTGIQAHRPTLVAA